MHIWIIVIMSRYCQLNSVYLDRIGGVYCTPQSSADDDVLTGVDYSDVILPLAAPNWNQRFQFGAAKPTVPPFRVGFPTRPKINQPEIFNVARE